MVINDVYLPHINNPIRHLVLYGSASSGKSAFAAQKTYLRIVNETPHRILVLRKVSATIKKSVFQDMIDVINEEGAMNDFKINRTIGDYSLTHNNGNQLYFVGLDDPEKIKSIKGITSMWVEEATEFNLNDLDQLNIRIRGKKNNYVQYVYTFNPISEGNDIVKKFVIDKDFNPENTNVIHSTYKDNAFLTKEDKQVLEDYKTTNKLYYDVYCLGIPGAVDKTNKFFFSFDRDQHIDKCSFNPDLPIKLSFDFNLEPFACVAYQTPTKNTIEVIKEIRLNDSDIYQMCDRVKSIYPESTYIVTGDRTGYNRSGVVRGKTSYWSIIKTELGLTNPQIRLRSKNLDLISSRILCNAVLNKKNIIIDPSCENLINDMSYAQVDYRGELLKDRSKHKNDFGDCARYCFDMEFPELITAPKNK